jgi:hypothetical protein
VDDHAWDVEEYDEDDEKVQFQDRVPARVAWDDYIADEDVVLV